MANNKPPDKDVLGDGDYLDDPVTVNPVPSGENDKAKDASKQFDHNTEPTDASAYWPNPVPIIDISPRFKGDPRNANTTPESFSIPDASGDNIDPEAPIEDVEEIATSDLPTMPKDIGASFGDALDQAKAEGKTDTDLLDRLALQRRRAEKKLTPKPWDASRAGAEAKDAPAETDTKADTEADTEVAATATPSATATIGQGGRIVWGQPGGGGDDGDLADQLAKLNDKMDKILAQAEMIASEGVKWRFE